MAVWGRPGGHGWFRSAPNYGATTSFKQSSSITKTTQQAHGIEREGDTGCTNGATGGSWGGGWAFELGDTRALREGRQSGEESECCAPVLEVQGSVDTVRAAAASQCARHAPCSRAQIGQLVRGEARSCGETLFSTARQLQPLVFFQTGQAGAIEGASTHSGAFRRRSGSALSICIIIRERIGAAGRGGARTGCPPAKPHLPAQQDGRVRRWSLRVPRGWERVLSLN